VVEDAAGDGPVAGAEVQLVDASGKASKATTDAKGSVKLPSASAPYDLSVKHASMPTPYVVLGRRETSVRLPVWTVASVPASQRTHAFNVVVQVPPCSTNCGLSVLSSSVHGGGQTVESIPTSASWRTMNVTLQHSFYRGGMGASELVTIHAISSNADQTSWGYREVASSGQKGGESTVGMGSLVQVGVRGSLVVNGIFPDATDNLTPSVGAALVLAGGARLPLFSAQAASGVAIVPDIPASFVQATASLRDMALALSSDNELHASAQSELLPPTTASVDVTAYAPPAMTSPLFGAPLASGASAIAWTSGAPGLAYVELVDIDRKEPVAVVLTDESAIPLAKLRALGFADAPSTYAIDMSTIADVTLAQVIDANAPSRRPFWISDAAQSTGRATFRFTLSP